MNLKKLICIFISIATLLTCVTVRADFLSQNLPEIQAGAAAGYSPDDKVTFIVEVEGDPELVSSKAQEMGAADYIKTTEAKIAEAGILQAQTAVFKEIKQNIESDIKKGYTYTALFNGFSIDGEFRDREAILALPGVKNVYISKSRRLETPALSSAGVLTGVPAETEAFGFKGEGQVIAVIDSEFDTGHEFFSSPVANPKYTKSDIENILNEKTLNVSVSVNQVYKNSKIPFAFDYVNKNSDTFDDNPDHVHGTHVAGIAAGKNGTAPDGTVFSGVAPEAQIILMKITDRSGMLLDDAILAAIDDASKFGVSAINMSFGADYIPTSYDLDYLPILSAARNAGIFLSASAGNANRGYNSAEPLTKNIDYAASGTPNSYSVTTSVASVDNLFSYTNLGKLILPNGKSVSYNNAYPTSGFDTAFENTQSSYVYCGLGRTSDFNGLDLTGKIALVRRGENFFSDKSDNAKVAGAAGLIIWNTENEFIQTSELSLPCAAIQDCDGQLLLDADIKQIDITPLTSTQAPLPSAGKPSSFTSWGTSETLELKPELSAPGGQIYSSVPNDKYQSFNGTSMAAPHIAGLVALLNQFYETNPFSEKYNNLSGNDKVSLFENLMMSSASAIRDERDIPYSARRQGAGLVNIKNAMSTPVFLEGPDGKTKISLGQGIDDAFTLCFKAHNLADRDVTYDNLEIDVTTDGYVTSEGKNYVGGTIRLTVQNDLPSSITVPANGETDIIVNVTLDNSELLKNAEIFKNGFYIDGYVTLASSEEIPKLNIPFTGFRGNWRSAPIFDTTIYDKGGSTLYIPDDPNSQGTYLYSFINENASVALGRNAFSENIAANRQYIAISPNGDGVFDRLAFNIQPLRSMSSLQIKITDSKGKNIRTFTINKVFPKFTMSAFILGSLGNLTDGDYIFNAYGTYAYPGGNSWDDSFSIPFTIDTEKPVVTDIKINEEEHTLSVTAADNHYVSAVAIGYTDETGRQSWNINTFDPASDNSVSDCTAEFNISGLSPDNITLEVYDYALNVNSLNLSDFSENISISLTSFQQVLEMTAADFTITNRTGASVSGSVIFSFYDKDNRLICLESDNVAFTPGEQLYTLRIAADTQNASIMKFFFWNNLNSMSPMCPEKIFDIK